MKRHCDNQSGVLSVGPLLQIATGDLDNLAINIATPSARSSRPGLCKLSKARYHHPSRVDFAGFM
jgi:hypothetical protein